MFKLSCINFIKFLIIFSVKSKVRGNLEIYHAYVRDLDASTTSEPDWEVVDSETSGINGVKFDQKKKSKTNF